MSVLNAAHLLDQAALLIAPRAPGPPRQVDLRRAISAAYYALFHHVAAAAADEIVGVSLRSSSIYALVYRSVDHGVLRAVCEEVIKPQPSRRYRSHLGGSAIGEHIPLVATSLIELQERRHLADYDPSIRIKTLDATVALRIARRAIGRFELASRRRRRLFLMLLLFRPR